MAWKDPNLCVYSDAMLTDVISHGVVYPNIVSLVSDMVSRVHTSSESVDPNGCI